jgi:acetyl-CoA carboxylase carboxyl transferase subunit beta
MGLFGKRSVDDFGEKKRDMPEGLWTKCPSCSEVLHEATLTRKQRVCESCGHHFTQSAPERIASICDEGSFEEMDARMTSVNALGFKGYLDKVKAYQEKTGIGEAVVTGRCAIEGQACLIAVMDFRFLGASMGSVVGEKITRAIEAATAEHKPVIVFSASGGARMHEGILSLMQMAKTSGALARHAQAGYGYISVLTHPTTGGVTASYATLGDVILAEPKCMIGFAGPRVVKETTHADLPPGFQTAEFMMEHGLVDVIVERKDMRSTLARLIRYMGAPKIPVAAAAA